MVLYFLVKHMICFLNEKKKKDLSTIVAWRNKLVSTGNLRGCFFLLSQYYYLRQKAHWSVHGANGSPVSGEFSCAVTVSSLHASRTASPEGLPDIRAHHRLGQGSS